YTLSLHDALPIWSEVVVDHVEEHHQAGLVRRLHQGLQLLGPPVDRIRRVGQHPVVAPVAPAGEVRERHELDRGDPELPEVVELRHHAAVGPLRGEGAYVQLVDHRLLPGPAAPGLVVPLEGERVDHLARAVDVARLEARGRVGHRVPAVDAVAVEGARPRLFGGFVPTPLPAEHGLGFVFDHQIDLFRARRPQPKAHAAVAEHLGAERHGVPSQRRLRGHQRSSSSAAHSFPPRPNASARANTSPARMMRKLWRTMSPPMLTWSSAISTTNVTMAYCASRPRSSASWMWTLRQ